MRLLLAAGGTGGHIYPALALGAALKGAQPEIEIHYCCGNRPGELEIYKSHNIAPMVLPLSGRRPGFRNSVRFAGEFAAAWRLARRRMRDLRPALAVGFGNYISIPALLAARTSGALLAIHEQNAEPGAANRFLAPLASLILLGLPTESRPLRGTSIRLVGNPVRDELLRPVDPTEARRQFGIPEGARVCLCFGGSLGAQKVNQLLMDSIPHAIAKQLDFGKEFCESSRASNWHFLWSTGRSNIDPIRSWLAEKPDLTGRVALLPYIDRMDLAYAAADLVVARAGALTLAELTALGKPAILVPLPHSARDHQRRNARALTDAGAAILVEETGADAAGRLAAIFGDLASQSDRLVAMGHASRRLGKPDSARKMAEAIGTLLATRRP